MAEEAVKTYNQVENGVYDCVLTGWAKRAEKQYGRDAKAHYIIQIGVRKADDPDAQMFVADLPLVYTVGIEWSFWDENLKMNVARKTTAKDTASAIEYARKCIPAWGEFVDKLPESSSPSTAFAWFGSEASVGAKVRAKLTNRAYTVDGVDKVSHEARLYEAKSFSVISDDFDAAFGKSLKAAQVKFGKGAKTAAKAKVEEVAAAPDMPPEIDDKSYTREDAWKVYEKFRLGHGHTKEAFWGEAAEVIGKELKTYKEWTSDDWKKCCEAFVNS